MTRQAFRVALTIFTLFILFAVTLQDGPLALADTGGIRKARIDPALLAAMRANPKGEFHVIVRTGAPDPKRVSPKANTQRAKDTADRLKLNSGKHINTLAIIGGASATLSRGAIDKLSRDPMVSAIDLDKPMKSMGSATGPLQSLYTQIVRAPEVWAQGITGQGITVAVIDSGVAPVNDLGVSSRIVASVDFTSTDNSARDPGGHGTHVAGIVGGNGYDSGKAYEGIAPDAKLVNVRVIGSNGTTRMSTVVRGIQWVVQNRKAYAIRVMNLSLGGPATSSYRQDPLAAAVEIAWYSGIVVVSAAGNNGPTPGTIVSPASDPYVITVGASDDNNTLSIADDTIPYFSSRGPTLDGLHKPDLVAPGRKIISLRARSSFLDNALIERRMGNSYFRLTGTSMAAPIVAGVAALMLQSNPSLKPDQIKNILTQTARPLSISNLDVTGAGLVDAYAAVNSPLRSPANRGLRPSDEFCKAVYPILKGMPLNGVWRDPNYQSINWSNITWDNITWDNITWDNITWDNITWDNITWDTSGSWENVTWDNISWDSVSATGESDSVGWDGLIDLD